MILRHVTENSPLPAVFAGICCGILLFSCDGIFLGFAALLSFFLVDARRIPHFVTGLFIGLVSIFITPQWADINDGQHTIEGTVHSAGFYRGTFRVILKDFSVDHEASSGLAQLNIYKHVGELGKGDHITAHADLKRPRMYGNAGEFDYQEYLLTQGIVITGSIKDFKNIVFNSQTYSCSLRNKLVSMLSDLSRPEAEVLKAILAGDRSGLTYSLNDSFAALGIAHVLAISGLHMGIIILMGYGAVFSILRIIPPLSLRLDVPLIAKTGGILFAAAYTIFAGATVPTLRAAVMAGCVLGSLAFSRKANLLESLAFAGILILVVWPLELFSVSFLLSFAAVLGIIAAYSRLETCPRWMILAGIPLGAMVFTLPVVVYVFGFISPWGLLSNLVIVPFFSFIIMPFALLGLVMIPLSDGVSSYLLSVCMDCIGLILKTSHVFGMLKPVARPWIIWVLACYLGLITAFFTRHSRIRTFIISTSCFLVLFMPFIAKAFLSSKPLCFDFISVGQGDSTLITKGKHAVLIDAGGSYTGFDTGRFIVGPHLLHRGITSLDLVVISHTHPDHIGGMPFILDRFEVKEVWTNVSSDWTRYFQDVIRITKRKAIPTRTVGLGDIRSLESMEIVVLNPPKTEGGISDSMDQNLHSIVLKVSDKEMGGLFMADADGFGEIRISRLDQDLSADVLKVAHHGSRNSCYTMLLDRVKPQVAVILCGYDNRYNLPDKETLARLKDHEVEIFRTDIHGETMVYSENMDLKVKSLKGPADNYQDRHGKCIFFLEKENER
ncbi:MAG: DNA internalization-related competence protein ComEC/Rec2 [Deltaproteobacteria bacterium]|nr:DNA internalization-related competence protein ComEC/Rec2 [Deltaproteobacteria bacterium]